MASVPALKGVRTRYRNTLIQELHKARDIMKSNVSTIDREECLKDIQKTKRLLKAYSEKLTVQMEKLTDSLEDSESDFITDVIDEDCEMNFMVENCLIELEQFTESLAEETESKLTITENDRLVIVQEQMQKMMLSQMEQQRELVAFIDKNEKSQQSSVKLPKLDMNMFYGNKVQWCEFWDTFECTVHRNTKLTNVEKFNYLQSKLGGEAKRAIAGISRSSENYAVAVHILRERFGNKQEIVDLHYKELLNIKPPTSKVESLRVLLDLVEKHLRSLEVLGENVNQHVFVSMIRAKLTEEVLRQLELKKGTKNEWTVESLRWHLRDYVTACEKSEKKYEQSDNSRVYSSNYASKGRLHDWTYTSNDRTYTSKGTNSSNTGAMFKPRSSAEALMTNERQDRSMKQSKPGSPVCRFCAKKHWSDECSQYKTIKERKQELKGCCYRCLKEGHIVPECKSNREYVYCNEYNKHHRSLCPKRFKLKANNDETHVNLINDTEGHFENDQVVEERVMVSHGETVFMQTANTTVQNPETSSKTRTRILLDCGSQRTYITQSLVDRLGLKKGGVEELKVLTFGSEQAKVMRTPTTTLKLTLNNGRNLKVTANIVPVISGSAQRKSLDMVTMKQIGDLMQSLNLSDSLPTENECSNIDLLIGNDYYLDLVLPQRIELSPGLYLLGSKLGWILTGRTKSDDENDTEHNLLILTYGSSCTKTKIFCDTDSVLKPTPDVDEFWNIESIGVTDNVKGADDKYAMNKFKDTITFENERYQVTWPWKDEEPDLSNNRQLAYGRLKSCLKRMRDKPEFLDKYDTIIQDQLIKGVIEKVDEPFADGLVHYIPHHAVITPQKTTTKVRVVYDASAKPSAEQKSLNECLFRGPVMLHNLCGILMKFRLHNVAIVSDIEKAFLQIGLQPSERDVTRFFWVKDIKCADIKPENIVVYRFCRVPFGIISSPFLLGATIETHLDTYNTELSKKLKNDIYVDNIITGANSDEEAITLYQTSKRMFLEASMNLREWLSNSEKVNELIPMSDRAEKKEIHILGHTWDYRTDTLSLKPTQALDTATPLTKRNILKRVASVFDPMGLFSPIILRVKILLQEIWSKKLDWDDVIDEETINNKWSLLAKDLQEVSNYQIPRRVADMNKDTVYNILCFCDASSKAYAAAVYIHQECQQSSQAKLIFAKTRLAPVKGMTIPRLELMAVLIGVRCMMFVKEQLHLEIAKLFLWSDSQVVLSWINSVKDLPVFVKNRVVEIKGHEDVKFGYVNTKENPADVATRGTLPKELSENKLWWNGPEWLNDQPDCWSSTKPDTLLFAPNIDEKDNKGDSVSLSVKDSDTVYPAPQTPFGIDIERYSSVSKLLRVTAIVQRFSRKLRRASCESKHITSTEIRDAETLWIKFVQKNHYSEIYDAVVNKK